MQKKTEHHSIESLGEIRELFLNAIKKKGWYFFRNPQLSKCRDMMDCRNSHCPSYESTNLRCWHISGTFCKGKTQGVFAKKIGDCHKCRVYRAATEGDAVLQIGEDFNNLMFQLKTKEEELTASIQNTEEKNRKLAALNDRITNLVRKLDGKNALLREISIKDELTGLYNYRFFREILREQFRLAKRHRYPLACIMIDIDFFKAINDTYGHLQGDLVLAQLAALLKKSVRDTDKVIRYGGEEFVVILPYSDREDAHTKAEALRKLVSGAAFAIEKKKLKITISLGVAVYSSQAGIQSEERLICLADKALYQAKEGGRNRVASYNGEVVKENKLRDACKPLSEKRKYSRVHTLIKLEGGTERGEMFFSNTFDISLSGLSLLSARPVRVKKELKIKLYLPGTHKGASKARRLDLVGTVARCQKIASLSDERKPAQHHLIGIQFKDISPRDVDSLRGYFISLFK